PGVDEHSPPEEQARQTAFVRYYHDRDVESARRLWTGDQRAAVNPTELALQADVQAESGSDRALADIQALRAFGHGEGDALLATLRFRQGRYEDAAAALEEAFERFRTNPWALTVFKQRALVLAGTVATRSPQIAARMFQALAQPFAVRAL